MKVGESVVGVQAPSITVLTYDDGPTPGVTDVLLDVLAEAGVTATFFVLLTRVRRSPGLLAEVLAAGHEVALHGPDHRRLTGVRRAELDGWMHDGRSELEDRSGREVRWFRPPYGAQSRASWRAAVRAGMTPVHWSVSYQDWLELPLEEHLDAARGRPLAGELVLLHDGYADAIDNGPGPVVDRVGLTRAVLAEIADQGLTGSSLGKAAELAGVRTVGRLSIDSRPRVRVRRVVGRAIKRAR